jgi:Sulfotransferase domain
MRNYSTSASSNNYNNTKHLSNALILLHILGAILVMLRSTQELLPLLVKQRFATTSSLSDIEKAVDEDLMRRQKEIAASTRQGKASIAMTQGNTHIDLATDIPFPGSARSSQGEAINATLYDDIDETSLTSSESHSLIETTDKNKSKSGSTGTASFAFPDCPDLIPHPHPTFILAGSQKAGTSALYALLGQHPDITRSTKFEPHFFDNPSKIRNRNAKLLQQDKICSIREHYYKEFDIDKMQNMMRKRRTASRKRRKHVVLSFEKTPAYLCRPHVPAYIARVAPWTKILIVLRNPVNRAYSHWKMIHEGKPNITGSFDEEIAKELKTLRLLKLSNAPRVSEYIQTNMSANDLSKFQTIPASIQYRSAEHLIGNRNSTANLPLKAHCGYVSRGFYAQQLYVWLKHFELNKNLMVIQYEDFQNNKLRTIQEILSFLGADPSIHFPDELLHADFRPHQIHVNDQHYDGINETIRQYLQRLYQPYNDELADLLQNNTWRGVWD